MSLVYHPLVSALKCGLQAYVRQDSFQPYPYISVLFGAIWVKVDVATLAFSLIISLFPFKKTILLVVVIIFFL